METLFWHKRWKDKQIGFNQTVTNQHLMSFWHKLAIKKNTQVLVPLCGKSIDMLWLQEQGHDVFGIELSGDAVKDFFIENKRQVNEIKHTVFQVSESDNIQLYQGDFFQLTNQDCAGVSAVYDRAALIALPKQMRQEYVEHLFKILPEQAPILLITMEYEQSKMAGPPFSVTEQEVLELYAENYKVVKLEQVNSVINSVEMVEKVYLLS